MLTRLLVLGLLAIIFLLLFIMTDRAFQFMLERYTLRNRLRQGKGMVAGFQRLPLSNKANLSLEREVLSAAAKLGQGKLLRAMNKHMNQLMHSLRLPLRGDYVLTSLVALGVGGLLLGYWLFGTMQGMLLLGAMIALLPYLVLRLLLVHRRLEAQIDFLPALEAFYQCYLITGERQIKVALARLIEEKQITGSMKRIYEQLYRNLSVLESDEESLQLFAYALGHVWADYFVQMLRVAMSEGVSISSSLRELIGDMRAARRANEQERHRLLEIRIANFTPLLFLALFVGINFYYNREQSIQYYFYDVSGREMMLHMMVMIFLSFLMGLYLSRKKL